MTTKANYERRKAEAEAARENLELPDFASALYSFYPLTLTPERAARLGAIMLLQTTNFDDLDHIEIRADSVALCLK